jgi:hypothetical protein
MAKKKRGRSILNSGSTYDSYNFTTKDPLIYDVYDAFQRKDARFKECAENGGAKVPTLMAWFFGNTVSPRSTTVRASLRAIGCDLKVVDSVLPVSREAAKLRNERVRRQTLPRKKKNGKA